MYRVWMRNRDFFILFTNFSSLIRDGILFEILFQIIKILIKLLKKNKRKKESF